MQPTSRHESGMTLPEILVSMGILSLVLLGVYSLLNFALKWHNKMDDSVEVYQQTLRASTKLGSDLGSGSGLSFFYEVDGLAFVTARPGTGPYELDPSGQLLYHRWIIYHLQNGNLYRNEVPLPAAQPVTAPFTETLTSLRAQMNGPGQLMAERVTDLEIVPGAGAAVRFKVTGERPNDPNSLTIQTRMTFRQ